MGRRSKAVERRGEALDAFDALVAEEGLAGASLGRLAERLGWHKPMLTHYFGSRDALVAMAIERIRVRWFEKLEELDDEDDLDAAIEYFCGFSDNAANRMLDALFDAGHRNDEVRELLQEFHETFIRRVSRWLRRRDQAMTRAVGRRRATALMALVLGGKKLGPLDIRTDAVRWYIRQLATMPADAPLA